MKPYAKQASVQWSRTRRYGKGVIRTPTATLKMALGDRAGEPRQRGTDPPELIAAAHAASFSLTLANELAEAGCRVRQIDTTATVTMEHLANCWTITQIHLNVVATVPKLAECGFIDAALRAKANCPVSRALKANISMTAHLHRNI